MQLRKMWAPIALGACWLSGVMGVAQGPKPRLARAIDASSRMTLPGSRPPEAAMGVDEGALPPATALPGITMVLNRSVAQQADLDALLAAQQDVTSPLYHQWLSPDQFAARFGVADADLAKVEAWLQAQGFKVDSVARSRDRITFDGTAGQVAAAFGTDLHRYQFGSQLRFAPAGDLTLPANLAPLVTAVRRLSDFKPHRETKLMPAAVKPAYTSSVSGSHFLTPQDIATMYDMTSTYKAGFTGTGQGIAIIAQSYIGTASITAFQAGAGLTANLPNLVLVPNTGVAAINPQEDGDEGESQLDVEYASGMAPGANVYLVYTGDSVNASVFDSLAYAVAEDVAPVISGSYTECETEVSAQDAAALTQELQQANAQGQTVVFASGDTGSTACYGYTNLPTVQQFALAANFPPTSPNVTAVGGTQMAAGSFATTNTQYWQSATGTDVISSLLSYVPEVVWNEDAANPLSSGGGGASTLFPRPSWQAGVAGIPTGTTRLIPDIALQASIQSPGFIYCTSDPSDLSGENLTASCTNGLRSPAGTFAVAGGTSFSAPIFAGMLAVLNQVKNATGQGNVNPTMYSLASNSSTYTSVFHDIVTGTNACTASATYCSTAGASAFAATTGYDEATGLGSFDFAKLVAAWPTAVASSLAATTTTVVPASATPTAGSTDLMTITIKPANGSSTVVPTGTVKLTVDGTSVPTALTLANGVATYTYTVSGTTGSHTIVAIYSGDGVYAPSTGTAVVTVGNTQATGAFSLAAQAISVQYNNTATGSFVVTPSAGYTGTVAFSLSYPANAPTLCYAVNQSSAASNVSIASGAATTATLLIGEGTACGTSATGAVLLKNGSGSAAVHSPKPLAPSRRWPEGVAFAGLIGLGLVFRRSRRVPTLLGVALLAGAGLGLTGCGGSSGTGTTTTSPTLTTQTVTVTLTGVDSINSTITNTTSFTVTVHP